MPTETATEDLSIQKIILYTVLFIAITVPLGIIFARSIAINNRVDESNKESTGSFIAPNTTNTKREITGKIVISLDSSISATHKLLNPETRETLAYLYADNDILKVSEGFSVTVNGQVEEELNDEVELIKVESIRLK